MKDFSPEKASEFEGKFIGISFSEKKDGPMNFVGHELFDSERRANRAQFLKSLGFRADQTVVPKVVHGSHIQCVSMHNPIYGSVTADAIITDKKGLVLTMNFGDCPPVALYDPINEVLALVHCGWKPLSAAIIKKTLEKMRSEYNCFTRNITAFIGPGICQEHYEVGPEVAIKFGIETRGEKMLLDLVDQICKQLVDSGVRGRNIINCGECTYHEENESGKDKYFSWRRDKSNPLDVNMAVAWIKLYN